MKLIVEEKDLLECNFDEDLLDDVINVLDPIKVEIIYDDGKKKEVISSGCTNQNITSYKAAVGSN